MSSFFAGTVIWVEDASGQAWTTWEQFLSKYQHACQTCDPSERSLFCLSVVGKPNPTLLSDVALNVRRWKAIVGRLDMTLYVDRILFSRFPQLLHHKVALAVVTELAGSDPYLAHHLAIQELSSILDPMQVLQTFAAGRGWTLESVEKAAWQDGICDEFDGTSMIHSAAAALAGNEAEVVRRVWRGQVTVLYPYIEDMRVKILPQVRSYLRLPVETTYGRVDDAEDLEVGQLLYFLRGKRIQPRLWRLLKHLTDMRHSLAHLQPVPLRSLYADEVLRLEG